jgi:hypothetical protein
MGVSGNSQLQVHRPPGCLRELPHQRHQEQYQRPTRPPTRSPAASARRCCSRRPSIPSTRMSPSPCFCRNGVRNRNACAPSTTRPRAACAASSAGPGNGNWAAPGRNRKSARPRRNFNPTPFANMLTAADPALRFNPFIDYTAPGAPSQAALLETLSRSIPTLAVECGSRPAIDFSGQRRPRGGPGWHGDQMAFGGSTGRDGGRHADHDQLLPGRHWFPWPPRPRSERQPADRTPCSPSFRCAAGRQGQRPAPHPPPRDLNGRRPPRGGRPLLQDRAETTASRGPPCRPCWSAPAGARASARLG